MIVNENWAWIPHAFSLELRKFIAYRSDFWLHFAGTLFSNLGIAYFLWKAIYAVRGGEVGGYGFHAMMFYYLIVAVVAKLVQGQEMGVLSQEIYQGSLNRYLVYPIPFFPYKYVATLAKSSVVCFQLLVAVALFGLFFGFPESHAPRFWGVAGGVVAAFLATYLYFALVTVVEMVAFWADNVWSLVVMIRLSSTLLGGVTLPLTVFPAGLQEVLRWSPFPYLYSFPTRVFLNELGLVDWARGILMILFWSGVASAISALIWRRGLKQYAGVGI